ncbi:MAG: M23 family metallopeptidase [Solirubrobacterales bacterium]
MRVVLPNKRTRVASRRIATLSAIAGALFLGASGTAHAQVAPSGGGAAAPGAPTVAAIQCVTQCIGPSTGIPKSKIRLVGTDLSNTTVVSLPRADGTRAKDPNPIVKPSGAVIALVGKGAVTGPVRTADTFGQLHDSAAPFTVGTRAQLRTAQLQYRFPVRGAHSFGDVNAHFGAGRSGHSHQGQDIFAACGTTLVAPHGGLVEYRGYQGSAGNYLVIDGAGVKEDYVLMHLQAPAKVARGQEVSSGQFVGKVGDTGNASGCHLHFEIWKGKGWYSGGAPIDPYPTLLYWDSFS